MAATSQAESRRVTRESTNSVRRSPIPWRYPVQPAYRPMAIKDVDAK